MRLSTQEEYGLRCLLAIVRLEGDGTGEPVTIEKIAVAEGVGYEHAAKMLRLLRRAGILDSVRGANGGYLLARQPSEISLWDALVALDPPLVGQGFCEAYAGHLDACVHAGPGCNLRALWTHVGNVLEGGLKSMSLEDLRSGRVPGARETA